ncbi:hypothetical protein [Bradyrhizobium sp. RD5-C2]|uniref:hypothetical protein n=1 Tax=Bradyrhizobium sp. RD5-C2 TaxID=244562 RepID=UPI001CC6695D|nr:hypothetical protein [Bradyrhizobium sp. RD5-C2]GIQ77098.1 hypothetical protein BraRD5C2_55460 [Bradyrhizobium sp. RD5-C2]
MSASERIYDLLSQVNSDGRNFPATIFYNEGWLLRLVLDWFFRQKAIGHKLSFAPNANWFSEALLGSQFLSRGRWDALAEGFTHADGVIGHFSIGRGALANVSLAEAASQFIVAEAKLFSPLSSGVTNARYFNQAARNVACIAYALHQAELEPSRFSSLAFYVLAPREQIEDKQLFAEFTSKPSIREKVSLRVTAYQGSPQAEKHLRWQREWFEPTLERAEIACLAWEDVIEFIRAEDDPFGSDLSKFYKDCCKFNRVQEPDLRAST